MLSVNCYIAAIPKVLAHEHRLDNVAVTVEPYYKWLGAGSLAAAVSQTHLPPQSHAVDSVTVTYEPKTLDYIMQTPAYKKAIETKLERESCLISWPDSPGGPLELNFKKTAGHKFPDEQWADKCTSVMGKYLSEFKCETMNVLQEIWNSFKAEVEKRIKSQNPMVKHVFDDDNCDLSFVGPKDALHKFRAMVESVKAGLEQELRKKHEQITETISNISCHQLMILRLSNYADEVAADAGNDTKVDISQTEVQVTGMTDDVKRVKLKLYEKLSRLTTDMMSVSEARAELMEKESVKSHLIECFSRRKIVASWGLRDTELSVHAFSRDQLTKAKELIGSVIVEKEIPLDASSKSLMSQPKWKKFENKLIAEHKMVVVYKKKEDRLVLCCTGEFSGAVEEKVRDFIEKNCLVQTLVPLMRPVAELVERFMPSDLEKIGSKLMPCGGHIKRADGNSEPGFVLLGSRSAVELASSELEKLTETLAMYDHVIDRPGVPAYLMSTPGTAILSDLERRHNVVIDLENCGASTEAAAAAAISTAAVVKYSRKVKLVISDCNCYFQFVLLVTFIYELLL